MKISNSDNPGFNHLSSSSYSSSTSSSSSSSGFKPSSPPNVPPFRYIQSNPQQSLVSSAYLQPAHSAAQIASQYSLQASPLTNYYQSPAQLQYVSTPTVPQAPFIKFQGFGGGYSAGNSVADATSSSSSAQYSSQSHKGLTSGSQLSAASISTKELPLYQTSLPFYYAQQPFVTFFVQPQTGTPNFFYQHPGLNYFFKHQPQQYLGYQGLKGLGVYPSAYANQVSFTIYCLGGQKVNCCRFANYREKSNKPQAPEDFCHLYTFGRY